METEARILQRPCDFLQIAAGVEEIHCILMKNRENGRFLDRNHKVWRAAISGGKRVARVVGCTFEDDTADPLHFVRSCSFTDIPHDFKLLRST